MSDRATVTFHTSPETRARLDRLAALTRRSRSFLTNVAVERYLEEEEAFVAAVEAGVAQADAGELVDHETAAAHIRALVSAPHRSSPKPDKA